MAWSGILITALCIGLKEVGRQGRHLVYCFSPYTYFILPKHIGTCLNMETIFDKVVERFL